MTDRVEALQAVADLEPLAGDPEGIRRYASRYTRLAETVAMAVADLKNAIADAEAHESEAMTALSEQADEVVPQLAAIQDRYETAGSALGTFADVLDQARTDVTSAINVRDSTASTVAMYDQQIVENYTSIAWVPADQAQAYADEINRLENAAEPLTTSLIEARAVYDRALEAVETAGGTAERAISDAVEADGLTDTRWEKFSGWVSDNAGWIKVVKDALSIISTVLGVLSIFFPVLLPFAAVFAIATLLLSTTMASTGNGSWLDVGLDFVAVATLGIGSALGVGMKVGVKALGGSRAFGMAWSAAKQPGLSGMVLRPLRALGGFGDDLVRVSDDMARAVPEGMALGKGLKLSGRPVYRNLDDVWQVFRNGGVEGAAFATLAQNAKLGSGGIVESLVLAGGHTNRTMGFMNNLAGSAGTVVSWHDDLARGGVLGFSPGLSEPFPVGVGRVGGAPVR